MGKMELDDFIKYAKEQFGCEISVKKCDAPDRFAGIFEAKRRAGPFLIGEVLLNQGCYQK